MDSPRAARVCAAIFAAGILVATGLPVHPAAGSSDPPLPTSLGDLLRNLLLFAPLGVALAAAGWRAVAAVGAGLALSAAAELAQLLIPGRHAGLADWLANGAGTALGWLLAHGLRGPARGALLTLAAAGSGALLLATGPLLAPASSPLAVFGHLDPELAHLEVYAGSVASARLGELLLPHGPIPEAERLRELLRGDFRLRVRGRAGPAPQRQAAFLLITDARQRELLLLGPQGTDLILRYRSRGARLGLDPARLRFPDALAELMPGRDFALDLVRRGSDLCLVVHPRGLAVEATELASQDASRGCGLGLHLGDGWSLLLPAAAAVERRRPLAGGLWLAGLGLPLGALAGRSRRRRALGAAGLLVLLLAAPRLVGLEPTPTGLVAAGLAGLALGAVLRPGDRPLPSAPA